jgi:hypothetical protein
VVKRLIISRNAYLHIDRIVEFNNLRNQSTRYSQKFVKALLTELNRLKKFPLMGMHTGRTNTFLLVWDDYYTFFDTTVEIQSIYHQKENISR